VADFVSASWSLAIIVVVLLSIGACWLLAWSVSRQRVPDSPAESAGVIDSSDEPSTDPRAVGTTGHVWDETLEELNNPLPRWWLYLFYGTCVFGVVYLLAYPGLGSRSGWLDWSSASQYDDEVEAARAVYEPLFANYLEQEVETVAEDPTAIAMGERLFLTYCAQCHGSDARGGRSFPNLADNDWLGMATTTHVKNTILNGRIAVMPSMLAAVGNSEEGLDQVAHYVLSLSESNHDVELAAAGQARFAVCAACHGAEGKGNPAIGAPNLTDDIWLYGGSLETIKDGVRAGLQNQMPAFGELLGEGKAHVLAAYVWSLSAEHRNP